MMVEASELFIAADGVGVPLHLMFRLAQVTHLYTMRLLAAAQRWFRTCLLPVQMWTPKTIMAAPSPPKGPATLPKPQAHIRTNRRLDLALNF